MELYKCFDRIIEDEVPGDKASWHEWACIKAYLEEQPKMDCQETYRALYGNAPEALETAPRWLIILACAWKGAELGHARTKRLFSGVDKQTLAVVRQLDVKAIIRGSNAYSHLRVTDPELVA